MSSISHNSKIKSTCHEPPTDAEIQMQSRYRLIEALYGAERKASARVENLLEIVFEIDSEGVITFLNRAWENILGHPKEDVIGHRLSEFIHEDDVASLQSAFDNTETENYCSELRLQHISGRPIVAALCLSASTETDGGVLGSLHDVTHDRDVRAQMLAAKEEAERSNRTKSEFLAAMSHEIRTPLNALLGMSDLLALTPMGPVQSRYLQSIKNNSEILLALVCDILDVSKIEAGLIEFETQAFCPSDLLEEVAVALAGRSEAKGLPLVTFCDIALPTSVLGDANRIRQVLLNVVGNAIKFTHTGHVGISLVGEMCDVDSWTLRFEVSDTGIGIAEKNKQHIFERFIQGSGATNREFGGTGLGLSISHSLVELMGGNIRYESTEGQGTTFLIELTLPLVNGPIQAIPELSGGFRALLMESCNAQQLALKKTLEAWGIECLATTSSHDAIHAINSEHFDLLLVGWNESEMCSDDTHQYLLTLANSKGIRPIELSSVGRISHPEPSDATNTIQLAKPLRRHPLEEAIKAALLTPDSTQVSNLSLCTPTPREEVNHGRGERILVVEDNPDNQFYIERILDLAGYQVDIAGSGPDALEKIKTSVYRLIIMDIEMPQMDGFETTEAIRQWEQVSGRHAIPIVALTAHAISGYRERCLAVGMDDYLTKPIGRQLLIDSVHSWIAQFPTVLIVDDSDDSRLLIDRMLRSAGRFRILSANSGEQALSIIEQKHIAAVLVDVEFPDEKGWDIAAAIQTLSPDTRIMTITAHDNPTIKERCLRAGSMAHVSKPVRLDSLLALMERALPMAELPSIPTIATPLPTVNVVVEASIADIIPRYLSNRRAEVALLDQLLAQSNFEEIRRIGHNMKGSGSGYGIEKLSYIGAKLEQAALTNDIVAIAKLRANLDSYLSRLRVNAPRSSELVLKQAIAI